MTHLFKRILPNLATRKARAKCELNEHPFRTHCGVTATGRKFLARLPTFLFHILQLLVSFFALYLL